MKTDELTNIGKSLAEELNQAGIKTPEQLFKMGSEDAFKKLLAIDNTTCINSLYALEGAIQSIRWHNLNKKRKNELSVFYNELKKLNK